MSYYPEQSVVPTKVVTVEPVIQAAAYSAGDAVGGKLTFSGLARAVGAGIKISGIVITDKAKQAASLDLVLFDRDFTATADNSPFDPSDDDLLNIVGVISVVTADYSQFVDNAVVAKSASIACRPVSTGLFGQLVSRGTPTFAATSDLSIKMAVEQS